MAAGILVTGIVAAAPAVAGPIASNPHQARKAQTRDSTALSVALTSMSPEIPRKGAITLTGRVTNSSQDDWTEINVAPFIAQEPITTRDELAAAAKTAPDATVGNRLTDPGTYVSVGDLAPGRSAPFSIRIPVKSLTISGDSGVYWIGVHALGTTAEGRDLVADGRARTFIPLVTPDVAKRRSVPVSVVLPLRDRARRSADGSLNGPTRWVGLTSSSGRLRRLVEFGSSAGNAPITWLVDPAVLDALDDFARGNPPLSLGSRRRVEQDTDNPGGQPSEEPSASPTPSAPLNPDSPSEQERTNAKAVLDRFVATARTHSLLTLGYSDPDVVSLARRRPSLNVRAEDLAARQLKARGLSGTPAVAPPNGYFDPDLLSKVPRDALLLLSDQSQLSNPVNSRLPTGQELVMSDQRAVNGGPSPIAPRDPLALRQRILSEAALEAAKGAASPRPIIVNLPRRWNPGARWRQADFFGGLQTTWLRMTPLPRSGGTPYDGELTYGRTQLEEEIGSANVAATRTLVRTSGVLGDLLANQNDVTDHLTGAALQASAYSARPTLKLAADLVHDLNSNTRAQMDRVQVTGTDFVTLSGGSGSLTVTLVNGLKQPITVGLRARADSAQVRIATPDPVSMEPGQRTTLRLKVTSGVGVHDVTISPVTTKGQPTGTPLTFSLRTSQVGRLIWYIIIAGGTLLAVMIVRRITLRIRSHRWRQGDAT
jgi:Family of unknown function (DUF6049)